MSELAIVFGYALFVVYLFYLSYDLMGKPRNKIESVVLKWMQPQHVAVLLRILAMWSVVGGVGLLRIISGAADYAVFIDAVFVSAIWGTLAITLIYLSLYFTFQVSERIQDASKWRYK